MLSQTIWDCKRFVWDWYSRIREFVTRYNCKGLVRDLWENVLCEMKYRYSKLARYCSLAFTVMCIVTRVMQRNICYNKKSWNFDLIWNFDFSEVSSVIIVENVHITVLARDWNGYSYMFVVFWNSCVIWLKKK